MRNKVELLAPAGSPEGIRAAVQSGAGAVYMGFGMFNARRNAQGFSHDEMAAAIAYCRARDVKTNITLNILAGDRELEDALEDAKFLYEAGADALIVQDLGLARLIHAHAPDFALHASTQMTIHTLDAAKQARDIGFSRVVLSRECSREEIKLITEQAGVETEVFVHGALCMCYSGQCYLSAVITAVPPAVQRRLSAVAQGSHARRTRCRAFRLGCVLAQDRGPHEASGVRRYCNQGLL